MQNILTVQFSTFRGPTVGRPMVYSFPGSLILLFPYLLECLVIISALNMPKLSQSFLSIFSAYVRYS